jgi:hypothetical protein
MTFRRVFSVVAGLASLAVFPIVASLGCSASHQPTSSDGQIEVVGTLIALKDDRPVDGGIDLTLETGFHNQELVRVPSVFIAGPRDAVRAMHDVVDAARIGDRLRARGTRDAEGALRPETLELVRF